MSDPLAFAGGFLFYLCISAILFYCTVCIIIVSSRFSTMNTSYEEASQAFSEAQMAEMLGDYNRWFAGKALGREPSRQELQLWYIEHGGAADFRRRNHDRFFGKDSQPQHQV
jgi:hypothetical protein